MNARECLVNVERLIEELKKANKNYAYNSRYTWRGCKKVFNTWDVCDECGIFDWWHDTLSNNQLKQMQTFLKQAILLGFDGYVCFKVGAVGCSHGMWAHKKESTDGYSPDGDVIFHSFRSGDNYFDMCLNNIWMSEKYRTEENPYPEFSLKQIKEELLK